MHLATLAFERLGQRAGGVQAEERVARDREVDERRSQVDVVPLRLVADCLLVGRRNIVEPVAG